MSSLALAFFALGVSVGFFVGAVFALGMARRHSLFPAARLGASVQLF